MDILDGIVAELIDESKKNQGNT
jgi:hypothetical protein